MNKAFSCLAKFLLQSLQEACTDISLGAEGVAHFTNLKNHMVALTDTAKDPRSWKESKLLEKEYTAAKRQHQRTLCPGMQEAIADSVKSWNTSSKNQQLTEEVLEIYTIAKSNTGQQISTQDYNKFTQCLIFAIATVNRNRQNVVAELTNGMIWSAEDVYLDADGKVHIGVGGGDRQPNGRVVTMQRSSGATKTEETVSIYINTYHLNLCRMYRDMKEWFFSGERSSRVSPNAETVS